MKEITKAIIGIMLTVFLLVALLVMQINYNSDLKIENAVLKERCAPQVRDMQKQEVREVPTE